ncbi:MAG: glycosyltransferase [Pseudomonadales bacterium]|nr:glycosyltransferase [Pseudomonadales bacterium]
MKILHVVPTYYPAVRYGGPIVSVHGLCRSLVALGHEVHVFTTNVDGDGESDVPTDRPVEIDGVKVWYFKSNLLRRLYYSPDMQRGLKRSVSMYDLVHVHSMFLWPTLVACREAYKQGIPYVLAPRGMLVPELIKAKSQWIKTLWIRLFDARNVKRATALHLTSKVEAEALRLVVETTSTTWIVPNGVDVATCNEWQGSVDGDQVLYIGRINWKKGLERLIRAAAAGAPGRFTIAGNDEDGYLPTLKQLIEKNGLHDRFYFSGPVFGDEKDSLLRRSDLFVLPSINENFGNSVLEAMAQGCPVAVSETSGIVGELPEGAVHVMRNSDASVASAIGDCLMKKEKREALSKTGFDAAGRFSWDKVARDMADRYEELLNG